MKVHKRAFILSVEIRLRYALNCLVLALARSIAPKSDFVNIDVAPVNNATCGNSNNRYFILFYFFALPYVSALDRIGPNPILNLTENSDNKM